MSIHFSNPVGLYDPSENGYSHVCTVERPNKLVFVAGQGGENADGSLPHSFSEQVANALKNLKIAIEAAGCEVSDTAKIGTYIVDYDEARLSEMNEHLVKFFAPGLPTQTLVPVPRLALDGMLFEIEATLVKT